MNIRFAQNESGLVDKRLVWFVLVSVDIFYISEVLLVLRKLLCFVCINLF